MNKTQHSTQDGDLVPKPELVAAASRGLWQRLLSWYLGWLGSIFIKPPR